MRPLAIFAAGLLLSALSPAIGAPKATKAPGVPVRKTANPLAIPGFNPIPDEFVFAGNRQDVDKVIARYTGGVSLEKFSQPTPQQLEALDEKKRDYVQGLLEVKRILAPIHMLHVRSISYYALGEAVRSEAIRKLVAPTKPKANASPLDDIELNHRGYEREQELLRNAETFYKELLVKQGGQMQLQLRGETSISVYAFAQPPSFAVVTRGPSRVIVARADGKPDVGAITSIFQRVVIH